MKVYVQGHNVDESRPSRMDRVNIVVAYCATPDWTTPSKAEADMKCAFLTRNNVHLGSHACTFVVEQLADSEFTIVCLTHPEDSVLNPPAPRERF